MAEATEALPQSQPSHCCLPLFVTVEAFNPPDTHRLWSYPSVAGVLERGHKWLQPE